MEYQSVEEAQQVHQRQFGVNIFQTTSLGHMSTIQGYPPNGPYPVSLSGASSAYPGLGTFAFEQMPERAITDLVALSQYMDSLVAARLQPHRVQSPSLTFNYNKPYPYWHGEVSFPPGYLQPNFLMFNGTGDSNQHLAHFLFVCGDTMWNCSLLPQQFVLLLRGVAFEWYSRLLFGSIPD